MFNVWIDFIWMEYFLFAMIIILYVMNENFRSLMILENSSVNWRTESSVLCFFLFPFALEYNCWRMWNKQSEWTNYFYFFPVFSPTSC